MATINTQPSVMLLIEGSAIAFSEGGEILESVERHADGTVDWADAVIADHRGIGGAKGYNQLRTALEAAEANALVVIGGGQLVRVPDKAVV